MSEINANEDLIFMLTSEYVKKYNNLPNTHRQAIQWAYEQGIKNFVEWYDKHENKGGFPYTVGNIKTCLSAEGILREFNITMLREFNITMDNQIN